jgi:hypothetical protein
MANVNFNNPFNEGFAAAIINFNYAYSYYLDYFNVKNKDSYFQGGAKHPYPHQDNSNLGIQIN